MPLEEDAESPEGGESDVEADLGDTSIGHSQQVLGFLESKAGVKFLRSFAERSSKRAKAMPRRKIGFESAIFQRDRLVITVANEVAGAAKPAERGGR
jgi:hypothetical protein